MALKLPNVQSVELYEVILQVVPDISPVFLKEPSLEKIRYAYTEMVHLCGAVEVESLTSYRYM